MWGVYVYEVNQDSNVKGPYIMLSGVKYLYLLVFCVLLVDLKA